MNISIGLLVEPLQGSWSDVAGHRPVLLLFNLGLALQAVVYLLVLYLKLPMVFGALAKIISRLLGDTSVVLAASFSYVAACLEVCLCFV